MGGVRIRRSYTGGKAGSNEGGSRPPLVEEALNPRRGVVLAKDGWKESVFGVTDTTPKRLDPSKRERVVGVTDTKPTPLTPRLGVRFREWLVNPRHLVGGCCGGVSYCQYRVELGGLGGDREGL